MIKEYVLPFVAVFVFWLCGIFFFYNLFEFLWLLWRSTR